MSIDHLHAEIKEYIANHPKALKNAVSLLQLDSEAKILIIGQAPGNKAHCTGKSWNDASGNRLREWLGVSREIFYNPKKIALISMGFTYPGLNKKGGDNPPHIEDAKLWHEKIRAQLPHIALTILVGSYAQHFYIKNAKKQSLTQNVMSWREFLPSFIVLPHPSWRNNSWIKYHLWFEQELIPYMQQQVRDILL